MKIEITEAAVKQLEKATADAPDKKLRLEYDTEGCGCVVDGVAVLLLTDQPGESSEMVETNSMAVYLDRAKMVYLDEELRIDFSETANAFQLKSPSQMLNPRMSLLVQ